jgi:hypothetical protein
LAKQADTTKTETSRPQGGFFHGRSRVFDLILSAKTTFLTGC